MAPSDSGQKVGENSKKEYASKQSNETPSHVRIEEAKTRPIRNFLHPEMITGKTVNP